VLKKGYKKRKAGAEGEPQGGRSIPNAVERQWLRQITSSDFEGPQWFKEVVGGGKIEKNGRKLAQGAEGLVLQPL